MKKIFLLSTLLLSIGIGTQTVNADENTEIDYSRITTESQKFDNGLEIITTTIPNEYLEQWKQENNIEEPDLPEEIDTMQEVDENGISPLGATIPFSHWNLADSGNAPKISGSFTGYKTLYSNYNYSGLKTYNFQLSNTGGGTINYQWKDVGITYASGSISGGETKYGQVKTPYASYAFYLRVVGASGVGSGSISGYIKK